MSDINVTVSDSSPINVSVSDDLLLDVTIQGYSPTSTLIQSRIEIESEFKFAYSTRYKEFTFTGSNLTQIDVWDTSAKGTKLFTKTITYDAGNIDTITLTDELSGTTLTKQIAFVDGVISTITETIA